jgi:hypothetical protein
MRPSTSGNATLTMIMSIKCHRYTGQHLSGTVYNLFLGNCTSGSAINHQGLRLQATPSEGPRLTGFLVFRLLSERTSLRGPGIISVRFSSSTSPSFTITIRFTMCWPPLASCCSKYFSSKPEISGTASVRRVQYVAEYNTL